MFWAFRVNGIFFCFEATSFDIVNRCVCASERASVNVFAGARARSCLLVTLYLCVHGEPCGNFNIYFIEYTHAYTVGHSYRASSTCVYCFPPSLSHTHTQTHTYTLSLHFFAQFLSILLSLFLHCFITLFHFHIAFLSRLTEHSLYWWEREREREKEYS